jgi:hypothetical protein
MRSPKRTLAAVLPALALAATAAAAPAQRGQVVVDAAAVRGLESRLDSLAAALPAEQRQLLADLLLRAAAAPADNPAGTTVRPVFYSLGGRGIIVQGGRGTIIVQGGRAAAGTVDPRPTDPNAPRPGNGAVAIGPKQDDPGAPRPTNILAIGPKQDDPAPPPPANTRWVLRF